MTTPIERLLGKAPPAASLFSTRPYGTSKAEAAAQVAAAGGAAYTTGGSGEAAQSASTSGPPSTRSALP